MSGLEVVGIFASIVQIADLGAKISVKLCSVYRTVKDANGSMRSLSSDASLTCSVLRELASALDQDSEDKAVEELVLQWTTVTREEMEAEVERNDMAYTFL